MSDRYQFDVDEPARVVISMPSGDVEMYESANGVEVELSGKTDGITVTQAGNTVSISADKRVSFFTSATTRAAIGVPAGTDLELSGASLDLISRVPLGEVRAKSASGDIRFTSADELQVKTASGDLRFESIRGDCEITAASGDVVGDVIDGELRANVASGDIRIGRVGRDVVIKSASGDTQLDRADGNDISVRSMSGDIVIGLPSGIRLDFDLDALSGNVIMPPPLPPVPPIPPIPPFASTTGSERGLRSEVTVDDDRRRLVRVYAKTVSGDINIQRAN